MYINPEYLANVLLFVGLCVAFLDLSPIFGSDDTAEQDTTADDQATPPEVIDPETLLPDPETPDPTDPDTEVTENDPLPSYIASNYGESAIGTAEADFMSARASAALFGHEGDDQIQGSSENDYLEGDAGNDSMSGADGNDFADGGSGNDTMYGMNGDDQLFFTTGDTVIGGEGADTFHMIDQTVDGADTAYIYDFESGVDKINVYYQQQFDEQGTPIEPTIGTQIDSDQRTTTVFVDGNPVLVVGQSLGLSSNDIQFVLPETLDIK